MLGFVIQLYKFLYYIGLYVGLPGIESGVVEQATFYLFAYQCLIGPVFLSTTR
jgi:hypothetical protein